MGRLEGQAAIIVGASSGMGRATAQACVFAASLPPRTYVSDLVLMPGALQCNGHPVA